MVSHRLVPLPSGATRIVYSTEITGPDGEEVGPMVTADFPDVLAALKRLAERLVTEIREAPMSSEAAVERNKQSANGNTMF